MLETIDDASVTSDTLSLTEYGSYSSGTYTINESDTSTTSITENDNAITGDYVNWYGSAYQSTVIETGSLGTGSYTLSKTVTGDSYTLVEGNSLTGDYTSDITAPSTRTSAETSNDTVTSIFTETETDAPTTVETGNSIDGSYTQGLTNTILTTDSINYDVYASMETQVTESSSTFLTGTQTGNYLSGDYTLNESSNGTYTMTETNGITAGGGGIGGLGSLDLAVDTTSTGTTTGTVTWSPGQFSLNEYGSLTTSLSETGNQTTGRYTRAETAQDTYSMTETGGNTGGSFTETVTGTDSPTLVETGNSVNQWYSRTVSGTDSYSRTDGGPGATLSSGSGTITYTLAETSDARAGILSQTESGTDRYGLLERYRNVANTGGGNQPGSMDYWPFGQPFFDPGPLTRQEANELSRLQRGFANLSAAERRRLDDLGSRLINHGLISERDGSVIRFAAPTYQKAPPSDDELARRFDSNPGYYTQLGSTMESKAASERNAQALRHFANALSFVPGGQTVPFIMAAVDAADGNYGDAGKEVALGMLPFVKGPKGLGSVSSATGRVARPTQIARARPTQIAREAAPVAVTLSATTQEAMVAAATRATDRTGSSLAGAALQSHRGRPGSWLADIGGTTNASRTAAAQSELQAILQNGAARQRWTGDFGEVVEVRLADGRGARFGVDGTFIGWLERYTPRP